MHKAEQGGNFICQRMYFPPNDEAILNMAPIINMVMLLAAKGMLGAFYINAQETVFIQCILKELGYPQP